MFNKINRNHVIGSIIGFALTLLILNSFTITKPGMTKTQACLGKVNTTKYYTEGLHVPVLPWCEFDNFDTREAAYEIEGLTIPTQDRFNSTANVTVLYRILPTEVIKIRQEYGNQDRFIDVTLRQHLRAIARNEGRKIADSRGLANAANITTMQQNAAEYLNKNLVGVEVAEVLIQDIQFDSRITQQIVDTQKRIEKEEIEKSQLKIAETVANQAIETARGTAESSKLATDAATYKVRQTADADRYALEQAAIGNAELTKSLTTQILRKQELDNEGILYSKSTGQVPTTVIGSTDLRAYGVPLRQ